jgi:uncharacterized membrane protein YkvI
MPDVQDMICSARPYLEVEGCGVSSTDRADLLSSLAVACTYIGTVVGAGFASGQEIYQFFGRFGPSGWITVAIAVGLFGSLGFRLLWLGWLTGARSYRQVNEILFGPRLGPWMDAVLGFMLFGVVVVMLAGAGQLATERLSLPFWAGVWWTLACTWLTAAFGVSGVLRANVIIVPVMLSFVLYTGSRTLLHHGMAGATGPAPVHAAAPFWAGVSCILYVAYNLGLASGVLIPVGAAMPSLRALRRGAWMGAAVLGLMLALILWMLWVHAPDVFGYEVPMGYVAQQLGTTGSILFTFALWGEIFSTLLGNVYALCAQLQERLPLSNGLLAGAVLLFAQWFSHLGFAKLVAYAYTLFGGLALLLLIALVWPRQDLPMR